MSNRQPHSHSRRSRRLPAVVAIAAFALALALAAIASPKVLARANRWSDQDIRVRVVENHSPRDTKFIRAPAPTGTTVTRTAGEAVLRFVNYTSRSRSSTGDRYGRSHGLSTSGSRQIPAGDLHSDRPGEQRNSGCERRQRNRRP
jgi:hypothetical protein